MEIRTTIFAWLLSAAMLAGCAAPAPDAPAPAPVAKTDTTNAEATKADPANDASAAASPAPVAAAEKTAAADPTPPAARHDERLVVDSAPGFDPSAPNRGCKTDADCAVKDVGNCCGRFPMCVNKDAKTDPAAVQAQCAKDGMASICGFEEVSACQCVQGQCQNIGNGAVVM